MWLGLSYASDAAQALEQGSPLDRTVFSLLTLAAFAVLGALAFEIFLAIREPRKVKASIPTTKPQRAIA